MDFKILNLRPDQGELKFATKGSVGLDLQANLNEEKVEISPGKHRMIPLGVKLSVPDGYATMMYARSSLFKKSRVILANSVGVIDTDYRGEVMAVLYNPTKKPTHIYDGQRLCQLVFHKVEVPEFIELTEEDLDTERGEGGFGSTD